MNESERLDTLANVCQLASFAMIFKETTNEELMRELRKQDRILAQQNNDYLSVILEKLERIENALIKKGIIDNEN